MIGKIRVERTGEPYAERQSGFRNQEKRGLGAVILITRRSFHAPYGKKEIEFELPSGMSGTLVTSRAARPWPSAQAVNL
jgi:hypothetical protein